jgi:hypothetical protein
MHPSLARLPQPGGYAAAWKHGLNATPDTNFNMGWPSLQMSRDTVLRDFRNALDRRINERASLIPSGRKHQEMYQTNLMRDAYDLASHLTQRVRIYHFRSPEVHKRFHHLLAEKGDQ